MIFFSFLLDSLPPFGHPYLMEKKKMSEICIQHLGIKEKEET
jgi:hypothetical protein